jgi:phosphoglycolate phosphatase
MGEYTMRIRGLLFDKDGTLLDYHASWMPLNWAVATFAAGGDSVLAERLMVAGGYDARTKRIRANTPLAVGTPQEIAASFGQVVGGGSVDEIRAEVDRVFQNGGHAASTLVPRAREAIGLFRERTHRLGIATSDSTLGLKTSMAPHHLMQQFDFACAYDSGFGVKPGPGMPLAFCKACGLEPGEIAVIGDNLHDIEMGRAAGAALTIGVLTGTSTAADLEGHADRIYPGIAEMAADEGFLALLG